MTISFPPSSLGYDTGTVNRFFIVSFVFSRSISQPPIITSEIGRKICVFPQMTLANSLTKSKFWSRISGLIISWVPYCTTGHSARATIPTSRIWQRRSLRHSPFRILHITHTSLTALALIDQCDQCQEYRRFQDNDQERLGRCHKVRTDPLHQFRHLCAGCVQILKEPAEGQWSG